MLYVPDKSYLFFSHVVGFYHFSESILLGIEGFPFAETVIRPFSFVPGGRVLSVP